MVLYDEGEGVMEDCKPDYKECPYCGKTELCYCRDDAVIKGWKLRQIEQRLDSLELQLKRKEKEDD